MQGRLLPPFEGRFQAFPAGRWRVEFAHAREAGLACIEWIYEEPHEAENPLGSDAGLGEIRAAMLETGVEVRSICADYYMTQPFVSAEGDLREAAVRHLEWLLAQAARLEVRYIVLPFVDNSSLRTEAAVSVAARMLRRAGEFASRLGLELHVECDLDPSRFRAFLQGVGKTSVKANYDIGNSAALGYGPAEELAAIGPYVGSVHVKDRRLRGVTVPLGTGDADFAASFAGLRATGFRRWFILQAARGAAGGEVDVARQNRHFVEQHWREAD